MFEKRWLSGGRRALRDYAGPLALAPARWTSPLLARVEKRNIDEAKERVKTNYLTLPIFCEHLGSVEPLLDLISVKP
jgi:hypothetical protein